MAQTVPVLKDSSDLYSWCKQIAVYLRGAAIRPGVGIRMMQTDGGTTLSVVSSSGITACEVVSESADFLTCAAVESINESGDPVAKTVPSGETEKTFQVMKPWILRSKPFDGKTRGGYSYVTQDQSTREATKGTDKEFQTITPAYLPRETDKTGELIYAFTSGEGLVDLNTAGRCWAVNDDYTPSLASIPGSSAIPNASNVPT